MALKYFINGVVAVFVKVLLNESPPFCSVTKPVEDEFELCQVGLQVPEPPKIVASKLNETPEQTVLSLASVSVICGSGTIVI